MIIVVCLIILCGLLLKDIQVQTRSTSEHFTFMSAAEEVCGSSLSPMCLQRAKPIIQEQCYRELAVSNGSCPPDCLHSYSPFCLDCMSYPCDQYCMTDGPDSFACQECMSYCDSAFM